MNIYIYNCQNTFNYGSMMMGENFISYLNKVNGDNNKYYIETSDDINIKRLKNATGINSIYSVEMDSLFKKGTSNFDYIYSFIGLKKIISDFINEIDMVVVLGGDDFTEDYGWKGPILNAIKFYLLKRNDLRVVMLGQTMGPYYSFRKPVMKKLLKKIDRIYLRDHLTYQYLKDLDLKNVEITDDLALLPLNKQEYKERTKEYITYCPSELIYRYSKEGKRVEWINFNVFMIDKIMEKYPDKKLVLLAHVLKPEYVDDRIIVNELYDIFKDKYSNRIIIENNEMYPYEVRNYIQQSLFTISSRMHPIVSSLQCEIPSIALSYSSKYWGIIGDRYELEDYIIDVRYSNYKEMKEKFISLLDRIQIEYVQIQHKVTEKNRLANNNIKKMIDEIVNIV